MNLDDLIRKAADQPLEPADVARACAEHALDLEQLCDAFSRQIARGYADGRLSFSFCDGVINHLHSYMIRRHNRIPPDYSYSVFLAFDAGEFHHPDDSPGSSPEDLRTKPAIARILASDVQIT